MPRVSVVVVSYNSRRYLERCLASLLEQRGPSFEVILVDNGSTDGGPEDVIRRHPAVRMVRSPENRHYTGGNNLGFAHAVGDLLASVNVDTEVAPGWLAGLVDELDRHPEAGLVTSKICLYQDRGRLNTCGNLVHVSGLGFCRGLGEPAARYAEPCDVPAISGAAFIARRSLLDEIGGFDESFYAYVEDTDLSLRAALAGHAVRYAPDSIVHHDYELAMRPEKFHLLERNRRRALQKVLRPSTRRLLWPALALADLMTLAFALRGGRAYLKAWWRARRWAGEHRAEMHAAHVAAQATRRVSDGALLARISSGIPEGQLGLPGPLARIVAPVAAAAFAAATLPARLLVR